jgi:uncharacterized protein YqeY
MSWQQFSLARVRVCVDNGGVMTMNEQITEGMKTAMRAKDSVALGALRGLKAAIQNARLAKGSVNAELSAAEEQGVVRKQIKQREDAIALYAQAGRTEQVEKEQAEIKVLSALLPSEMTEAEIQPLLEQVIAELGAATKKDMGRVMKEMQLRTEGRAPGKILSKLVASRLN